MGYLYRFLASSVFEYLYEMWAYKPLMITWKTGCLNIKLRAVTFCSVCGRWFRRPISTSCWVRLLRGQEVNTLLNSIFCNIKVHHIYSSSRFLSPLSSFFFCLRFSFWCQFRTFLRYVCLFIILFVSVCHVCLFKSYSFLFVIFVYLNLIRFCLLYLFI